MCKTYIGNYGDLRIFRDTLATHNQHILATGKSGAGKTTALRHLSKELQSCGHLVYFLDYSESIPQNLPILRQNILLHPYITNTFNQHNSEQNAVSNLLCYSEMIANVWKLGCRQRNLVTESLFRMDSLTPESLLSSNRFTRLVSHENGCISHDITALAYCLESRHTKECAMLADKFLDYALITNSASQLRKQTLLEHKSTPCFTVLEFPKSSQTLNTQIVDIFLWSLFFKYRDDKNLPPVTVICDEARLLNWSKTGIVSKIMNEGRKCKLNLVLATQSLTDELPKTALTSIMQADLHLAFAPPITDQTIISKSIFGKPTADNIAALSSLQVGYCFARGYLCSERTPTFQQTINIKIPYEKEC